MPPTCCRTAAASHPARSGGGKGAPPGRRRHLRQTVERGRERWRERERARERGRAERGDKTEGERGCAYEEITGGGGLISSWVVGPADYHRLILSSLHQLGSIFRC